MDERKIITGKDRYRRRHMTDLPGFRRSGLLALMIIGLLEQRESFLPNEDPGCSAANPAEPRVGHPREAGLL